MAAHLQLAILFAGTLACLVHLFGGIFTNEHEWFFAGPIALLAMIPVALRPRSAVITATLWALALVFFGSYFDEGMHRNSRSDLLELLEWAMLLVILKVFHGRRETAVAWKSRS